MFWPEKSIPKVNLCLGVTYDVINDDYVILWRARELKMTIDYIPTLTMLVLDSYVFFDEKSILIVYFCLGVIFDVINEHDGI